MARPSSNVRSTSAVVATSPACASLRTMYAAAVAARARTWTEVEDEFVEAMRSFDVEVAAGRADIGDIQNGKGDFFNDLLALLLEGCAQLTLYSRGGVPGFIFPNHNLDVTYPNSGVVQFTLEAKAVGTPKHPLSPKQKDIGRPGSADLAKRIKEVAFKTIDLKAEFGRIMAQRGEPGSAPGGNLTSWLRSVRPTAYLFIAARVVNRTDLDATVDFARTAAQVMDGVGLFCFGPEASRPSRYVKYAVPTDLSLDRVLYRACQDLIALKDYPVEPIPAGSGPAQAAQAAADRLEEHR